MNGQDARSTLGANGRDARSTVGSSAFVASSDLRARGWDGIMVFLCSQV